MKSKRLKRLIIAGLYALSSFAAMQAFASGWHEEPLVYNKGEVILYFGWYPDPPLKGEYEAFYFYAKVGRRTMATNAVLGYTGHGHKLPP